MFKTCAPFTHYKIGINNAEVDHAKDIGKANVRLNIIQQWFFENIRKFLAMLPRWTSFK